MAEYAVIDVSDWPAAGEEQLGTKPKQWIARTETDLWLWKAATFNRRPDGSDYRKGDDWSERVACEVGRVLGLPVAESDLAERCGTPGVISRRFLSHPEALVHGNELLPACDDPHDRTGYTIDAVAAVLSEVDPPASKPALPTAMDWFVGYLVLDVLIGNTDRHIENWGVVRYAGGVRLAPSFDHASSLGFMLSDQQRADRLETKDQLRNVRAYAAAARSKFEGRPHPAGVAIDGLRRLTSIAIQHWVGVVDTLPSIEHLVAAVPESRMSTAAKAFAIRLYEENHSTLSQAFRTLEQ